MSDWQEYFHFIYAAKKLEHRFQFFIAAYIRILKPVKALNTFRKHTLSLAAVDNHLS